MYIKNKSLAKPISLNSLNSEDFIVIDLRSKGYFLISHIKDALNIESLQRIVHIAQENPQKKILLYCHSGATAADFGTKLVQKGLDNIYYIDENYFAIKKHNITLEGKGLE
ncbi:rhodanese-like domain-containing protein [Helicobacter sp.]|uniref:rhodanese-like domain-containing protein n=1 Tax=Helicobacter sp. TaxID=218 RepID=UPI0025C3D352|nr:rhodanese-like domain-containing protein [Helicobacter sp.]MCI5969081.1 rhodanese-like domain-containing protein [Helicobacter sp.]MDY2584268.1 rhodanese-like domain-containing protein [Helicobacter sp.]